MFLFGMSLIEVILLIVIVLFVCFIIWLYKRVGDHVDEGYEAGQQVRSFWERVKLGWKAIKNGWHGTNVTVRDQPKIKNKY